VGTIDLQRSDGNGSADPPASLSSPAGVARCETIATIAFSSVTTVKRESGMIALSVVTVPRSILEYLA